MRNRQATVGWAILWLATIAVTLATYWVGLGGDFLFDDNPHIVRNKLVQIDSLSNASLWQAWNSSMFDFPNSRPLAMLTFGINHAVSGLNPFAFKATNLGLHLLTGLVLYAVACRLAALFLRLEGRADAADAVRWWAWLATALWLLHPLNLSPVLLSVQRMTILSTLFVLLGVLTYLVGRQRLADGDRYGLVWVWASPVFAAIGLLAKESSVLLPLLLFVTEWTLLRFRGLDTRSRRHLTWFFFVVTAAPILAAVIYLIIDPAYLNFSARPFDLADRVLTQARVLWLYVQSLVVPDISKLGLFHDDIEMSRSLLRPWTTLVAVIGVMTVFAAAFLLRIRLPLISFGILFFLAAHTLESSIFPLELMFEHRNYLPAVGPIFALAYLPTAGSSLWRIRANLQRTFVAMCLVALAAMTAMRALDWSSLGRLIVVEIENHPDSLRTNFQYAQLLMAQLNEPELREDAAMLARKHFERVGELDENNLNGMFGLVALDLELGRVPPKALIDDLAEKIRRVPFNPLNVSVNQFIFLSRWQQSKSAPAHLPHDDFVRLFESALANPTLSGIGRAGLYHALGAYFFRVRNDSESALRYARLALESAPNEWYVRDRQIRLLGRLGRWDEADAAFRDAVRSDSLGLRATEWADLADELAAGRRGEPVLLAPKGKDL